MLALPYFLTAIVVSLINYKNVRTASLYHIKDLPSLYHVSDSGQEERLSKTGKGEDTSPGYASSPGLFAAQGLLLPSESSLETYDSSL